MKPHAYPVVSTLVRVLFFASLVLNYVAFYSADASTSSHDQPGRVVPSIINTVKDGTFPLEMMSAQCPDTILGYGWDRTRSKWSEKYDKFRLDDRIRAVVEKRQKYRYDLWLEVGIWASFSLKTAATRGMDVYEFGTFDGRSMREIYKGFSETGLDFRHFWAFDSFEGLPPPEEKDLEKVWPEGGFNSQKQLGVEGTEAAMARIVELLGKENNTWPTTTTLIKGFYEVSLAPGGAAEQHLPDMKPALLVNCDADQYKGTHTMFEYLLQHRLIVPGTLIFFDDWGGASAGATFYEGTHGEPRAFVEAVVKYGIGFQCLSSSKKYGGSSLFLVTAVNY